MILKGYLPSRLPAASLLFQKCGWREYTKPLRGNKQKPMRPELCKFKDPQHYPHQTGVLNVWLRNYGILDLCSKMACQKFLL